VFSIVLSHKFNYSMEYDSLGGRMQFICTMDE
jgi:hypothetical protein